MADKHYRIAVIGTSIGSKLHVRALRGAGFEVTAMVGQDLERTQQRADHFHVPRATTSVDEVLDSDIDAVVVATPPASHLPLTMKAIAARKHVLCEKPFAVDAAWRPGRCAMRWRTLGSSARCATRIVGTPTELHSVISCIPATSAIRSKPLSSSIIP